MTGPNHYETLEIAPTATPVELKRTYRRLALQYHPDHNSSSEAHERFMAINEAYQTLSDPIKRRQYDRMLEQVRQGFQSSGDADRVWQQPASPSPPTGGRTVEPESSQFTEAYFRAKRRQADRIRREFGAYASLVKGASLLWLLFGLFLVSDWALQTAHGPVPIETVGVKTSRINSHTQVLVGDEIIRLKEEWHPLLEQGDQLSWKESHWLGVITEVSIRPRGEAERLAKLWKRSRRLDLPAFGTPFPPRPSIYNFFAPFWVIMILASIVGLALPHQSAERLFQIGLLATFFALLSLLFVALS
jgi:hypothetical protein